jgi:hypothetical protein
MNQLYLDDNKHMWQNVVLHYRQQRAKEVDQPFRLDNNFYIMLGRWLSAEENCIYMTNKHCLYFRDQRHLTMFILKWS